MQTPIQVTFRGFAHTPALDAQIRQSADELEPLAGNRITFCHVVVELSHDQEPPTFHTKIDLTVPGGVIVVHREPHDSQRHHDPQLAVRDAFAIARHQLAEWEQRHYAKKGGVA
jgi:hypothetical protein